MLSVSHAN